ncbi:type IVB secretion system protein IcmH/DotU [Legionella yabuuchiae]|uniref:type IVB secretion system protein IcmH/DotU n=1 Tax=Legionella yabuuchiae TaxID=376727 RepID=UPI0013EFAB72|nr:type IVB secretion system protein IcmH/DotU [Legionella yabuuchiae]
MNVLFLGLNQTMGLIRTITGSEQEQYLDSQALRRQCKEALNQFEQQALEKNVQPEHLALCKYALIAFIDELIIRQEGPTSQIWLVNPLQLEYFDENTAGQQFFIKLNHLRLQAERFIDCLEIYYFCLELGFEGQYQTKDKFELIQLKQALKTQIEHIRHYPVLDVLFRDETLSFKEPKPSKSKLLIFSLWGLTTLGFLYLILVGVIHYQAHQARTPIHNYQQAIAKSLKFEFSKE